MQRSRSVLIYAVPHARARRAITARKCGGSVAWPRGGGGVACHGFDRLPSTAADPTHIKHCNINNYDTLVYHSPNREGSLAEKLELGTMYLYKEDLFI